jgi:alpha,alpha-trehalose phosphorylase (configuration-retaining)
MAPTQEFQSKSSSAAKRRLSSVASDDKPQTYSSLNVSFSVIVAKSRLNDVGYKPMWAGIAGTMVNNNSGFEVAISIHDSVYNTDFSSAVVDLTSSGPNDQSTQIEDHVIEVLRNFSSEHMCKFLGAGLTVSLLRDVCSPIFSEDEAKCSFRLQICALDFG